MEQSWCVAVLSPLSLHLLDIISPPLARHWAVLARFSAWPLIRVSRNLGRPPPRRKARRSYRVEWDLVHPCEGTLLAWGEGGTRRDTSHRVRS